MSQTYLGRNAAIKIGTTTISNMMSWSIDESAEAISEAVFGNQYQQVQGVGQISATGSAEGLIDLTDSTGQTILRNAMVTSSGIQDIRFYMDATNYVGPDTVTQSTAACYVTNVGRTTEAGNGIGRISFSFVFSGPVDDFS